MAAGDPGSPARYYSSTAVETSLQSSIAAQAQGASNTSFIVASISGFPGDFPYTLIVDPDTSKEEVVTVTAGSSTTLTVTRGSDNTQGVAHSAGAVVRHGVSGRDFRESQTHIASRGYDTDSALMGLANQTHVHGIATGDGVVVGTTKAQTLTNKVYSSGTVTGAFTATSATFTGGTFTSATVTSSTITASTIVSSTFTGSFTASAATLVSPTISGSPVITGLSSAGLTSSSAAPVSYVDAFFGPLTDAVISAASAAASAVAAATSAASASNSAIASATSASASATSAGAAATSATSASNSASAAATSATSASNSADAASTSATSAANSATAAAASVATIASYATSAANSATAAATSETNAANSASAAATSAASASNSASAAATSAASALTSQTAAATSATSAANSASAAATSETNASNSATAAATSATSAANSASAAATSATSAASSATSAEAAWDSFDDRYLGPKSTPPTVDNDGNPLTAGVIYYNTGDGNMYVWSGSAWVVFTSTGDITSVAAGTGLTGGGTSGAVTLNLDTTSVYVVPSQSGQNGKYLTTNGSAATWSTIQAGSQVKIDGGAAATYDFIDFVGMGTSTATTGTVNVSPITVTDADPGKRIFVGTTTPTSPTTGDVWIDESNSEVDLTTMVLMGAY